MLKQITNIELVGIPFSTFTRTIRLGLEHKSIVYEQILTLPHTDQANKHHPFERIPSLNFEYNKQKQTIIESAAIANFIDSICPENALRPNRSSTNFSDILNNILIDELISIGSSYLFDAVEPPIVKTRLRLEKDRIEENEIVASLSKAVEQLYEVLTKLEQRSALQHNQIYLAGDHLTWADLFCYPALADLRAIPEGQCIRNESTRFPKLAAWMDRMESIGIIKQTMKDTLQDGWRPPPLRLS